MIHQLKPVFGKEEIKALTAYIKSGGWGTEHKQTKFLEQSVCEFTGLKHCSATTSGTMGLILSLLALDIGQGDEVIIPHVTMIATYTAVKFVGATPVLSGVGNNLCSALSDISKVTTDKTKAIIYVSLNGRASDLFKIKEFCNMNHIFLIEDACQSFGSFYHGMVLGTFGDIGVYSLSPHKIISSGQGGLIITNIDPLHLEIERLKDFGRLSGGADYHEHFGINAKYTDFQAVIALTQMKTIESRIRRKRQIFAMYRDLLPKYHFLESESSNWTPWVVDIYPEVNLAEYLLSKGIATRPMYPPLSKQPCVKVDSIPQDASELALRGLMLPSSLDLTDRDIKHICKLIREFR